jgi:hypothetical protein
MIANLLIGCGTMVFCLLIQCLVVGYLVRLLAKLEARNLIRPTVRWSVFLLLGIMMTMLAGNLAQMVVWAGLFLLCGEFQDFSTAFYHSVVNFSTLGYGDLVMSDERRVLGALEASNGVLMLGLTTSVLFAALQKLTRFGWGQRQARRGREDEATQCL